MVVEAATAGFPGAAMGVGGGVGKAGVDFDLISFRMLWEAVVKSIIFRAGFLTCPINKYTLAVTRTKSNKIKIIRNSFFIFLGVLYSVKKVTRVRDLSWVIVDPMKTMPHRPPRGVWSQFLSVMQGRQDSKRLQRMPWEV